MEFSFGNSECKYIVLQAIKVPTRDTPTFSVTFSAGCENTHEVRSGGNVLELHAEYTEYSNETGVPEQDDTMTYFESCLSITHVPTIFENNAKVTTHLIINRITMIRRTVTR